MAPATQARILLVEDDPGVARLEQLRLERAGYSVVTATTAEEGLLQIADGRIELIVLDQRLEAGTTGLDFFRQVKQAGHNVPAILVTGLQDEHLLVEALRAGVRDFVPKTPNFLNHLEPIVTRVIQQVRTERDLAESRIMAREHEAQRRELEHEIAQRKRVEQALREAEEYLRLMVESVKDFAIFTVDPQGRIVSWNPGAEQLFGYSEPDVLGQHLAILFTPEDRAARDPGAGDRGRRRPKAEQPTSAGTSGRTAAGSSPAACSRRFSTRNIELSGFTKIARDMTQRKEAEEAVREAAVRLKAIVDTAVDGIITIDEAGLVESMNLAAERIFGYSHDEVVGRNVAMLMSPPDRSDHSQYLANYLRTGQQKSSAPSARSRAVERTDRRFRWSSPSARLGWARAGSSPASSVTSPCSRKPWRSGRRLVAELGAERALLNSLLDNAPVGFGFFDQELRFLRLNPALAAINGLPIEAHLGRPLSEVLPSISTELTAAFQRVLDTRLSMVNLEVTGETPRLPGQQRYWLCNLYPVKTQDGTMLGAGAVVTDIDDRKRMEEGAQGRGPAERPVPRHARSRAPQPAGTDQQRRPDHATGRAVRSQLRVVDRGYRRPDQAYDTDGRRLARRIADHARHRRPPKGADRAGTGRRASRRGQPAR